MTKRIPYLKKDDTIGIIAPAYGVSQEEVFPAVDFLKEHGFNVRLGRYLFSSYHQFAGTDEERRADFQNMLDDPNVNAILCARGGYGSVRIVDQLNFSAFEKSPKWICGYSDITVLHSHIFTHFQLPTLHCTMPINIDISDEWDAIHIQSMVNALRGEQLQYLPDPHPLNRSGSAKGKIIGGNLSILYSLLGSPSDIDTTNTILFLEDVDEYLYHIDRMMMNMKRNKKLEKLSGMIVGGMSEMHKNKIYFGKTAEEIIAGHCEEYDFPLCFNFPAGHIKRNQAIRFGQEAEMAVGNICKIQVNG